MTQLENMHHKDFIEFISNELKEIIKNEKLLSDLDSNIDLVELKSILSLQYGESMTIYIKREDNKVFNLIVKQNATLKDLKESLQNHFKVIHKKDPSSITPAINWKYIWKTYCLIFDKEKLLDNNKQLRDYGIVNKTELKFHKFLHNKHLK